MAAPDSCDPCGTCIPPNMDEKWFWQALLNTQCEIIAAIDGGGGGGDVNVLSVIPGVGPTNLGKAEDAPALTGDTGVAALIKRTDTAAVQTDTNGDYTVPVANSFGAQLIGIDSTFQATAATGLLKLEDAAHVSGDAGVATWGVANTALAAFAANGDYTPHSVTTRGTGINTLVLDTDIATASSAVRAEDSAHASGDAGLAVWSVANTGLAVFGANGDYTPPAVSTRGTSLATLVLDPDIATASTAVRAENSGHVSGDAGVPVWFVRNTSGASTGASDGQYTWGAVNQFGVLNASPFMYNLGSTDIAQGILKAEDGVSASGDAGVMTLNKQQATPTNDVSADGDYQCFKGNIVGALYQEAANQIATYPTMASYAAASITTSFTTALTNSAKLKILSVDNRTDRDIIISFDATNNHQFVGQGASKIFDVGSNGRWIASNISAKALVSTATTGVLYIGGFV